VRVLCGQCGHVNKLDDDYAESSVACENCGRIVPVAPMANGQAPTLTTPADHDDAPGEPGFAEQARQAEGRKIEVTCSRCGRTVSVSARVAGRKARCKNCDHPLEIPWPDDLEDIEIPALSRGGAHENGLELVAPMEDEPPALPPAPEPEEFEHALELTPVSDEEAAELAELAEAAEAAGHDPVAALAAVHPAAGLEALERHYEPEDLRPPAPPEDAGELVSAVASFHEDKRAGASEGPGAPSGTGRLLRWIVLLAAAGVVVGGPLAIVVPMLMPDEPHDDITQGPNTPPNPATRAVKAGHPKTPSTGAVEPHIVVKPAQPTCEVLSVKTDPFAVGSHYPAPVDSVYWRIATRITAGSKPLRLEVPGRDVHRHDVRLAFGDERFDALGTPADGKGLFPVASRPLTVRLRPRQSREVTFLFRAPSDLTKGGLYVRGVDYVDVAREDAPGKLSAIDLAGTYVEQPPRHLKPLLRDPVMAAIQAAPGQKVIVAPGATPDGIELAITEAHVRGVGRQIGPGVFQVALTRGRDALDAKLRFAGSGRRLILYLADELYHQLTYVNPAAKAPAAPKPPASRPAVAATRPKPRPPVTAPGMGNPVAEDLGFDPNKPDPNVDGPLPTGPSIFD